MLPRAHSRQGRPATVAHATVLWSPGFALWQGAQLRPTDALLRAWLLYCLHQPHFLFFAAPPACAPDLRFPPPLPLPSSSLSNCLLLSALRAHAQGLLHVHFPLQVSLRVCCVCTEGGSPHSQSHPLSVTPARVALRSPPSRPVPRNGRCTGRVRAHAGRA